MNEIQNSLQQLQLSSQKSVKDTPFRREVIAPDKHPRVRWHSELYVSVCRNVGESLIFVLFLATCFVLGPSLIAFMYPNIIVPFNASLEWKCAHPNQVQNSKNLAWATNLSTGGSEVNIKFYVKNKKLSLDELERVLLVIDDCGFDDFQDNVLLCRPYSQNGPKLTFKEYMDIAEICYHYVRQMTRKAKISAFGKGIAANILLAAAGNLRDEYCFSFDYIFMENPINDVRKEFESKSFIGIAFMLPWMREQMITSTIRDFGLDLAEIMDNLKRVNTKVTELVVGENAIYGNYGGSVGKGHRKKIFEYMKKNPDPSAKNATGGFEFRHPGEGDCAKKFNKPLTSVMII
ncbi:uncharacterized protein CELE_K12D12.4 [Caenorhabditis elegans]|uniref:Uncharacterized protein n=1 Tax=Caenorhabditis elegans TaxID=6239 RepID=Q21438_CAEEL|nr:Uncharacterized protein CELE_K12D12.4 [Caenorhabditis elegans]CAA88866.4 Uncharacterized protein CELE_K12D12.4 [Caenorhabditis elegans]|eukprot:NP_001022251.2 Uncharacterized protein CELE_K12D12.4 [Caenorhabditis elegans]